MDSVAIDEAWQGRFVVRVSSAPGEQYATLTPLDFEVFEQAGCIKRGCQLCFQRDAVRLKWVCQHGDNPEARLEVPDIAAIENDDDYFRSQFLTWAQRIHEYEDGKYRPWEQVFGDEG